MYCRRADKFLNTNYYLLKKHIFKYRKKPIPLIKKLTLSFGTCGFISLNQQQFEFVYLRFFKKLLRRKFYKTYTRFCFSTYWLFIKSNFIYSAKSKNARMGAGVGVLVRLVWVLYKYTALMEFVNYPIYFLNKVCNYLNFKCNIKLFVY